MSETQQPPQLQPDSDQAVRRCDKCGQAYGIGEWPFCPHGLGVSAVEKDGIPGGIVVENYGPHPIRFDSHTERRKYMAEHGLREKEQWAPMPGTDKDPQGIPNPKGFIDAKTMDNARVLLSRGRRPTIEDFDDLSEPYSSAIEPFNNVGDNIAARMTLASATSKRDE